MNNKLYKLAIFAFGIAAVAIMIMFIGIDNGSNNDNADSDTSNIDVSSTFTFTQADEKGDYHIGVYGSRAESLKYVSVDECTDCHSDLVEGWRETGHGKDFTPGGEYPSVNNRSPDGNYSGSCAYCHVVGMGDTVSGGFDPNEWWSNESATVNQEVANIDLIGIQCEACHGPGSFHVEYQTGTYCADCKHLEDRGEILRRGENPAEWYGNPSVEESCMGNGESGCHSSGSHDKYTPWKASAHSNQDQIDAEDAEEEPHGLNSYCARCKSPSQYDPYVTSSTAEEFKAEEWHGIGCADCHDPHSDEYEYQLRTTVEEACTVCHTNDKTEPAPGSEPHHTQKEAYGGYMGIGVKGQKGMAGVTCVDCHMWGTPSVGHGYYMSNAINITRHETHSFEPTAQACADCHSDLMVRLPEHGRPDNNTGENEELWIEWDEWGEEWNETVEMWEMVIEDWESNYERLFDSVEANWKAAGAALVSAEENGTASTETLAEAQVLLDDAKWNIGLSNDGSSGVHNPDFMTDLLNSANVDSNKALKMITTNGPPIANAGMSKLVDTDEVVTFDSSASSDKDGTIDSYLWNFGDGGTGTESVMTHSYAAEGTYLVTLTVTDNSGATDTDMITVFVVSPPAPVDLKPLEDDIAEIQEDVADLNATVSGGSGADGEQVTTNKDDISDLDSKVSKMSGILAVGLIVILLIALAFAYFGAEKIKTEISETKAGIMETLEKIKPKV